MDEQAGMNEEEERLAMIVDRCLESEGAYKLFDMLASISCMDESAKKGYIDCIRNATGVYTEEEALAIERLIMSGKALFLKETIDQVRDERVKREIAELTSASV